MRDLGELSQPDVCGSRSGQPSSHSIPCTGHQSSHLSVGDAPPPPQSQIAAMLTSARWENHCRLLMSGHIITNILFRLQMVTDSMKRHDAFG
jgi:hypothetical protein